MKKLLILFCIVTAVASCATTASSVGASKDYYDLGVLYESQKDLARAIEMYTKAVNLDPGMRSARYNLAHAQILQGNFDLARPILDALHKEDPKNQAVMETFAYLEAKQGRLDTAWEAYRAVLTLTEARESVLFNLALIGKALGKKQEAYDYAARLVVIKPAEATYQKSAALLGLEVGKELESEALITGYLKAKEKDVVALLGMAEDLAALKYHSKALTIVTGIVAADPKNARALFIQAREYVAGAQDLVKGKASLQKAMEAGFSDDALLQGLLRGIDVEQRAAFIEIVKKSLPEFKLVEIVDPKAGKDVDKLKELSGPK